MPKQEGREAQGREAQGREAQAKRHVAIMNVVFEKETKAAVKQARIVEAGYAPEPGRLFTWEDAAEREPEAPSADAVDEAADQAEATEAEAEAAADAAEDAAAGDASAEEPATIMPEGPTVVTFASGDIVSAILHAEKPVAVLDAASYRYAGGGYLRGWSGSEEDLCAESNLYSILEAFQKPYYTANKQTASGELYTSRALAIPEVMFSRNGEIASCSVCVMAAPNRTRALERNRSARECDLALAERVDAAMRMLAAFGAKTVVVPAFGCGQMGNKASEVARLFRTWIDEHDGIIPHVEFALWRGPDADAFRSVFADKVRKEEAPVVEATPDPEDDAEEDDWEKYRISE